MIHVYDFTGPCNHFATCCGKRNVESVDYTKYKHATCNACLFISATQLEGFAQAIREHAITVKSQGHELALIKKLEAENEHLKAVIDAMSYDDEEGVK